MDENTMLILKLNEGRVFRWEDEDHGHNDAERFRKEFRERLYVNPPEELPTCQGKRETMETLAASSLIELLKNRLSIKLHVEHIFSQEDGSTDTFLSAVITMVDDKGKEVELCKDRVWL